MFSLTERSSSTVLMISESASVSFSFANTSKEKPSMFLLADFLNFIKNSKFYFCLKQVY